MDGAADDPVLADMPMSRIGEDDTRQADVAKKDAANEESAALSELPADMTQDGVVFPEGGSGGEDARRDIECEG